MTALSAVRLLGASVLLAFSLAACAAEEPETDSSPRPVTTACGTDTCEGRELCATYADVSSCVVRCETNSDCGPGGCCSYAHSAVGAYCVLQGDALGRAGDWCQP